MFFPTTVDRVPINTSAESNARIRHEMEERLTRLQSAGSAAIEERLRELDAEWDIERVLEANASAAVLVGVSLGTFVDKRFFAFPAIVASFLLQHALQGWCPPVPVFRRIGVRTQSEIDEERYALKAMRGDFLQVDKDPRNRLATALRAVRR